MTMLQIRTAMQARLSEPFKETSCLELTDGRGATRLAIAMLGLQGTISLRPAVATDEALLLRWAHDPDVRVKNTLVCAVHRKKSAYLQEYI